MKHRSMPLGLLLLILLAACTPGSSTSTDPIGTASSTVAPSAGQADRSGPSEAPSSRLAPVPSETPEGKETPPPHVAAVEHPEVRHAPIPLSRAAAETLDGLLLSVHADVAFADGSIGRRSSAIRVLHGEAWEMWGAWCAWGYARALDAFDSAVLFRREEVTICTPGESAISVPSIGPALATARIDGRRIALVAGADSLNYLDLDTLEVEPFFELDDSSEFPRSASFSAGRWVIVLAAPNQTGPQPTRIVFVDPAGEPLLERFNPFPNLDTRPGPNAATVASDGRTLLFSLEADDGSSSLVLWDLELGAMIGNYPLTDPFVPGNDPFGWGREYVTSIDVADERILVNVNAVDAEHHPSRVLLVDFEGSVLDLTTLEELRISAAAFLER